MPPEKAHSDWFDWLEAYGKGAVAAASKAMTTPAAPAAAAPPKKKVDPKVAEAIKKQARQNFPNHLDVFANLWLTAAVDALAGAPEAEDAESTSNWWIALGGNMVWAATCIVAPEAKLAIAMMSFGGAYAGSGGLATDPGKAPSGKKMISKLLTEARDALVKSAKPTLDQAATECGANQITEPDDQRKLLWGKLFSTPFDEADPIREQMSGKIEKGLASYLQQWHKWKQAVAQEALENANANIVAATFHQPPVASKIPFTPQLKFD